MALSTRFLTPVLCGTFLCLTPCSLAAWDAGLRAGLGCLAVRSVLWFAPCGLTRCPAAGCRHLSVTGAGLIATRLGGGCTRLTCFQGRLASNVLTGGGTRLVTSRAGVLTGRRSRLVGGGVGDLLAGSARRLLAGGWGRCAGRLGGLGLSVSGLVLAFALPGSS